MNIQLLKIQDKLNTLLESYNNAYNSELNEEEYENKIIEILSEMTNVQNELVKVSEDLHNVKFYHIINKKN